MMELEGQHEQNEGLKEEGSCLRVRPQSQQQGCHGASLSPHIATHSCCIWWSITCTARWLLISIAQIDAVVVDGEVMPAQLQEMSLLGSLFAHIGESF